MPSTIERVTIAEAALRLGLSYHQTQRLVLVGRLKGGRGDSGWYVDAESLEREVHERLQARRDDTAPAA